VGEDQSGQAIKLFQITRQWFPNTQRSWFLTVRRRLEKLVLPAIFDTTSFSPDDVKLAELSKNNF